MSITGKHPGPFAGQRNLDMKKGYVDLHVIVTSIVKPNVDVAILRRNTGESGFVLVRVRTLFLLNCTFGLCQDFSVVRVSFLC